jgi:hypothetical protein
MKLKIIIDHFEIKKDFSFWREISGDLHRINTGMSENTENRFTFSSVGDMNLPASLLFSKLSLPSTGTNKNQKDNGLLEFIVIIYLGFTFTHFLNEISEFKEEDKSLSESPYTNNFKNTLPKVHSVEEETKEDCATVFFTLKCYSKVFASLFQNIKIAKKKVDYL